MNTEYKCIYCPAFGKPSTKFADLARHNLTDIHAKRKLAYEKAEFNANPIARTIAVKMQTPPPSPAKEPTVSVDAIKRMMWDVYLEQQATLKVIENPLEKQLERITRERDEWEEECGLLRDKSDKVDELLEQLREAKQKLSHAMNDVVDYREQVINLKEKLKNLS